MKNIAKLMLMSGVIVSCTTVDEKQIKPNVIYILADDLGHGDLGCYGQEKISTPNIDKLASEGMLFTQHYSGSTVCAPSRSSLMTGLHTGHTFIRGNKEVKPEGQFPLAAEAYTIAELMKDAGYVTGAFGKWGLGMNGTEGDPNSQGFDNFFGYLCQRYAHRYYPAYLWENGTKVILEGNDWEKTTIHAPDVIQEKVLSFIKSNKDKPFFLYIPSVIPHAEILPPDDSLLQKYLGRFEETPFGSANPSRPHAGNDYGQEGFRIEGYARQEKPRAAFAALVNRLDIQVGEIVELLDELGLSENTIVIFTSDNGPHQEGGADPDYFDSNGPLKGYKRDLYEGGIRVPMIVKWPAKIKAGSVTDHQSAFWDFMPTLAELTQTTIPENIDGISYLPTLLGTGNQKSHDFLYWEFHELGGRIAVRQGDWKLVRRDVFDAEKITTELYNLKDDISESNNIAGDFPEIVEELIGISRQSHVDSPVFEFSMN
jgi:arylsulfatase A-like enzyme